MASAKIAALLDWSFSQGIHIDPRIEIRGEEGDGVRVFARAYCIESPTTLVRIPKTSVLSVRTSSVAEFIEPICYGVGAQLGLALAVHCELLKGRDSRWAGYLQSLPQGVVEAALFWESDGGEDGKEATAWIKGTELEKELRGKNGEDTLLAVRRYYVTEVQPLMRRMSLPTTLSGFERAYSLVASRAFLIDAYHGLAMVPIADAFNHGLENHVHLESDYDVCASCGSLGECPHDREGDDSLSINSKRDCVASHGDDTCDIVSNSPTIPNEEILNTYGEGLTNARLLAQYGFALDGNDNDGIGWEIEELTAIFDSSDDHVTEFPELQLWPRCEGYWADNNSLVVYDGLQGLDNSEGTERDPTMAVTKWSGGITKLMLPVFRINDEAKISHHLWLFCAVLALKGSPRLPLYQGSEDFLGGLIRRVAGVQVLLEAQLEDDGDGTAAHCSHFQFTTASDVNQMNTNTGRIVGGGEDKDLLRRIQDRARVKESWGMTAAGADADVRAALITILGIVHTVQVICKAKVKGMRRPELSGRELGEVIDRIARDMTRSRMAAAHALGERSILESCYEAWEDLGRGIEKLLGISR